MSNQVSNAEPIGLAEAAEYAGVAYATMAQAVREGRVKSRRTGPKTWLTTRGDIDLAISEGRLRPRSKPQQ